MLERDRCIREPMGFLNPLCTCAMCLAQSASTRKFLDSASSATSASGVAPCTRARVRCYCCSKRGLRALFNRPRLTMETANCMSPLLSRPPNWPAGNGGSKRKELLWKKSKRGSREGAAFYFRDPDGHLLELATPGTWSVY